MPGSTSMFLHSGLLVGGAVAWAMAAPAIHKRPELDTPLNVLGINRSPYGEVLALAVQGPIDQSFQVGMYGSIGIRTQDKGSPKNHWETSIHDFSVGKLISTMDAISQINTNPKPVSPAHRLHLRGQAEKKLRFAYNLDPSQYSNYNSLHFFLTEPAVGTHKQLTPAAEALAHQTIAYCLKQNNDPRPSLTAAAACTNLLDLMVSDYRFGGKKHTTSEMRGILALLDRCLAQYESIARQWDADGHWQLLSPMRFQECRDRHTFILKIRHAARTSVANLENPSAPAPPR